MAVKSRKRPVFTAAIAAVALTALAGCESTRDAIGITKQSPDEFAVVTRAPLTLPPDYGLRPPQPGAPRPQEREVRDSARTVLTAQTGSVQRSSLPPGASRGEAALLAKAGATEVDPAIRAAVDRESSVLANQEEGFVDTLLFWSKRPEPGEIVDAGREAQRLQENAALGNSPTTGRTLRIERKPKGWLQGIIN
jgi:hypothetical protein